MRRRRDAIAGWIAGLVMGLSQAWWWGNVYISMFVLLGGMTLSLTVWVALHDRAGTADEPRTQRRP